MPNNTPKAKCLSILGTGSDVGKSIVVTALCRIFKDLDLRVAPYKAQNMSNNSSVTEEGGEIGRAQVVQAQAARIKPHVDMNPILLKPSSTVGSQVILHGKPVYQVDAKDYFRNTDTLFQKSQESLDRMRSLYELVIMEGAGSCGEVNLRSRDYVNFKTAHYADAPVILVADIDRGGVFAQIIGTLAVIPEKDKKQIKGFIINRFRGDASLFEDGIKYLEKETHLPVLGLIPHFTDIKIDSEDSVPLEIMLDPKTGPEKSKINIAVIRLPHISNFTDFQPLENNAQVNLHYLSTVRSLEGYSCVLLPGTKNVRSDLKWLKQQGWFDMLFHHVNNGGELGGICGGYQMLGNRVIDPLGIEGPPGEETALGLLDIETTMEAEKTLSRSTGIWRPGNIHINGYEIHMGETHLLKGSQPLVTILSRNGTSVDQHDGVVSPDGKIWGTYFHGLFNNSEFRNYYLRQLKEDYDPSTDAMESDISLFRDRQYDLLADHFRKYLNLNKLQEIIGL